MKGEGCDVLSNGRIDRECLNGKSRAKFSMGSNCVDPDLSLIASDQELSLCNGTLAKGTYTGADCTLDGQEGCVSTERFKSIDLTSISSSDISEGVSIGGLKGSLRLCSKNGEVGCLATNAYSARPADCSTNAQSNCVTNSSFLSGDLNGFNAYDLRFGKTLGEVAGLRKDCRSAMNTTLFNYDTGGSPLAIGSTAQTGGSNGDYWDTIDDFNNNLGLTGLAALVGGSPSWGSQYYCDGSQISDVTSQYSPSNTYIACNQAGTCGGPGADAGNHFTFSKVYFDPYSGLKISNLLAYQTTGTALSWEEALEGCYQLNSGDGIGKWRIATQKELLQLSISGLCLRAIAIFPASFTSNYFWTSSMRSIGVGNSATASLCQTVSVNVAKAGSRGVVCVR